MADESASTCSDCEGQAWIYAQVLKAQDILSEALATLANESDSRDVQLLRDQLTAANRELWHIRWSSRNAPRAGQVAVVEADG
jgi:hypothetical protein